MNYGTLFGLCLWLMRYNLPDHSHRLNHLHYLIYIRLVDRRENGQILEVSAPQKWQVLQE